MSKNTTSWVQTVLVPIVVAVLGLVGVVAAAIIGSRGGGAEDSSAMTPVATDTLNPEFNTDEPGWMVPTKQPTGASSPSVRSPLDTSDAARSGEEFEFVMDDLWKTNLDLDSGRTVEVGTYEWDVALITPGYLAGASAEPTILVGVSASECKKQLGAYRDSEVSGEELAHGASFCVITSEGAIAYVTTDPWLGFGNPLRLTWILWK